MTWLADVAKRLRRVGVDMTVQELGAQRCDDVIEADAWAFDVFAGNISRVPPAFIAAKWKRPAPDPRYVWKRFGNWAAHLFVDGAQACTTRHGHYKALREARPSFEPTVISAEGLTRHGTPYGSVCAQCLRAFAKRGAAA